MLKILIAEDDRELRQLFIMLLSVIVYIFMVKKVKKRKA